MIQANFEVEYWICSFIDLDEVLLHSNGKRFSRMYQFNYLSIS